MTGEQLAKIQDRADKPWPTDVEGQNDRKALLLELSRMSELVKMNTNQQIEKLKMSQQLIKEVIDGIHSSGVQLSYELEEKLKVSHSLISTYIIIFQMETKGK